MDWWVYLLAVLGVILVAVAAAFLGRFLYIRQVRRSLVKLLGRREAIVAGAKGLERVLEHLMSDEEDALASFAADPGSEDRRALGDIAARMTIAADDLHVMALPKRLWGVAEDMERAARVLADEAGGVGESAMAGDALDALASIRMQPVRDAVSVVDSNLEPLLDAFHVYDPAVYGGGLYI